MHPANLPLMAFLRASAFWHGSGELTKVLTTAVLEHEGRGRLVFLRSGRRQSSP